MPHAPFRQLPYHRPKHFLFSAQKSGRTWVRMILAKVLEELGFNPAELEMLPSFHSAYELVCKKKKPRKLNVIFLFRDPRDCVVSRYFEISHRRIRPKTANPNKVYNSELKDYIHRADEYGIDAIVDYMNEWFRGRDQFKSFMSASYENLCATPHEVVRHMLEFIDIECSDEVLDKAVAYADFDNMRKIETSGEGNLIKKYHGTFGERHKTDDPNSFRVRKGKIGGFVDHLSPEDIEYLNERVKRLDEFFQYN